MTPLVADRDSGVDDWVSGLVTFLASPSDMTARAGTYGYNVIAYGLNGDENPVFNGGHVEVAPRTSMLAFQHVAGSWYTDRVESGCARAPLTAGMPVFHHGGDIYPATVAFDGVVVAPADDSYLVMWATSGWVEQPSWYIVTGAMYLTPGATYYLAPAGTLSTTGSVKVGVADTDTRLSFSQ